MKKRIEIKLETFEKIKKFASKILQIEEDVNISNGIVSYDAKSIIGVIAIDTSKNIFVEIISSNNDEIKKFNELMEEFKVI